jgi:hypothetical protein
MNNQIFTYKQQILSHIQALEKLCTEYLAITDNIPDDEVIVYSLGSKPIYDEVFLKVGESFYRQMKKQAE